ncbi:ead/Ea22-like family protein [Klebsiella michiganensis]
MTDITELAQSLKNASSKALIEEGLTWFSEEQLSHEDGIALHKADAEFMALANPANILALVEALEKAQQRITQLESRTVTVKPMRPGHITVGGEKLGIYMRDEVDEFLAALTAAGIKWEAE